MYVFGGIQVSTTPQQTLNELYKFSFGTTLQAIEI
jgi:hypothetical protein